jgi:hypothetical protein
MLDVIDPSQDNNIVEEVRLFLDGVCNTVLEKNKTVLQKLALQDLGEKLFYKHFIDTLQVKFFLLKMNEAKIKQFEEQNYLKFHENERKLYTEAKKTSKDFLESSIKHTVSAYKKYTIKMLPIILKLQAVFRGYLARLISKMEMMNEKLNMEQEKAVIRARNKTLKNK